MMELTTRELIEILVLFGIGIASGTALITVLVMRHWVLGEEDSGEELGETFDQAVAIEALREVLHQRREGAGDWDQTNPTAHPFWKEIDREEL
tara:strand:- start:264 stop:542 length:279 start_codon:yes stop_codon:yes gene_type:complete